MQHGRHQLFLAAVATLIVGVTPAWAPVAAADDASAPTDEPTATVVVDDGAPPADASAETPTTADPASPDEPVSSTDSPAPPSDTTEPADAGEPATDTDDVVATEEEGEDSGHGDGGHEGGGHGEGGTIPEGVTLTVDGRDITATDPAGSLPKIAGCSFDITASGLNTDPADTVGVKVIAWPPTVTEETRLTLVDVTETSANGTWAGGFPLDEAVQQFDRKGNGYHMRLELFVNGDKAVMKMYWLGCGEPQTGNPRRMLFDVQWYDSDGVLVTDALNDVLPAGWREDFALTASGERGTVACSYRPGDDPLDCLYDNPGHGEDPGLVLPGKPGMEYTVDVEGVPDGWAVDAETIGTFLADDTCPKGGGGHHEVGDESEDDHGEQAACTHTVVINQLTVVPPPDDEGGGGANPPDDEGSGGANPPTGSSALPLTGASTVPLIPLGLALMAFGTALVLGSKRSVTILKT